MSTFKYKNSLKTIEAQIAQKLKNNEARPKFTGSYKKKSVYLLHFCKTLKLYKNVSDRSYQLLSKLLYS